MRPDDRLLLSPARHDDRYLGAARRPVLQGHRVATPTPAFAFAVLVSTTHPLIGADLLLSASSVAHPASP
ncbi:MAG: hypothetical protein H0V41_17000 [Pseudonocardiales bacterium]|nr:hypothetical protein [Pseudonocardiales bacterium]